MWLVRMRRGKDEVIVATELGRPSADHLAGSDRTTHRRDVNGRKDGRWSRKNGRGPVVDNLNVGLRDNANVDTWATEALDQVRREVWNEARKGGMSTHARQLKGCRYAL